MGGSVRARQGREKCVKSPIPGPYPSDFPWPYRADLTVFLSHGEQASVISMQEV